MKMEHIGFDGWLYKQMGEDTTIWDWKLIMKFQLLDAEIHHRFISGNEEFELSVYCLQGNLMFRKWKF